MFISNFYGFLLDEFGMLSRRAGFSATAELSCCSKLAIMRHARKYPYGPWLSESPGYQNGIFTLKVKFEVKRSNEVKFFHLPILSFLSFNIKFGMKM